MQRHIHYIAQEGDRSLRGSSHLAPLPCRDAPIVERDAGPALARFWASVNDAGPESSQRWVGCSAGNCQLYPHSVSWGAGIAQQPITAPWWSKRQQMGRCPRSYCNPLHATENKVIVLTPTTLNYFCLKHGDNRFFSIWNHHKCLSQLFLIHCIPMVWIYDHFKCLNSFSAWTVFIRQILTYEDGPRAEKIYLITMACDVEAIY